MENFAHLFPPMIRPSSRRLNTLLDVHSYFSEGAGVAGPKTLVQLAAQRGYSALGLADDASVAGAVKLSSAAGAAGLQPIIGATVPVQLGDAAYPLVLLTANRDGYKHLNELLTLHKLGGQSSLGWADLCAHASDLFCLTGPRRGFPTALLGQRRLPEVLAQLRALQGVFGDRLFVQLYHDAAPGDHRRVGYLRALARDAGLPCVAAPEIRLDTPGHYPLLDALTCARLGIDVMTPHPERPRNDAAHLRGPEEWARSLPFPDALANADRLAAECRWKLESERLRPPEPKLPPGLDAQGYLEQRCRTALPEKYDDPTVAAEKLQAELEIVRGHALAGFFLTAAEVTDYCRAHGILAAGRGSAAGSVLCHLLGITLMDPIKHDLLFERFLHTGQTAMPDVDIDIASSRRDQVISWVEDRWGHSTQAMVANCVTYKLPSAVQDLGRALGLPPELRDRLTRALGRDFRGLRPHQARQAEVAFAEVLGDAPVGEALMRLLTSMEPGFVRHLAPHSGGVVLGREALTFYSPLGRSSGGIKLLSFDKDDIETLGLIKLDLLGLRMLAALERAREEILRLTGQWTEFGELPNDPAVWARIGRGDTLGLFQIESPAQVQMSARLQPKTMTQLAHQIALVRPGPIQSGTVHPYVRRARKQEPVPQLREPIHSILKATHGTLLFQEQILRLAARYAGMSWLEAEKFRKDLSKTENPAEFAELRQKFVTGAVQHCGAPLDEARNLFQQCAAFRGFGFAESHAWAFAGHAYASAYLRHHHPAAFLAGVLAEAPGMWPAGTLAQEARRWGVRLRPVCVNASGVQYKAVDARSVRAPLTLIEGVGEDDARTLVLERHARGPFQSLDDLYTRLALSPATLEALVRAGALESLEPNRRASLYRLGALLGGPPPGALALLHDETPVPNVAPLGHLERLEQDHAAKGLNEAGLHPMALLRAELRDLGCTPLPALRPGPAVRTAGLIVARQRPPTAHGFAFFVIEDGAMRAQVIISPDLWEAHRQLLRDARGLIVGGEARRKGQSLTLRAHTLAEAPVGVRASGYAYA